MPLSLRRGTVSAVVEEVEGLTRLEVDGRSCVAYPDLTGPVGEGDEVLVNTQAADLELGSGGFDVLYANLTRGLGLGADPAAHVMLLPYTPLQTARRHVEEDAQPPGDLGGMPVVCCTLHSQLAPVCAGLGDDLRVAYVQLPGGALPLPLSDAIRALKRRGLLEAAVSAGAVFGGDVQAVGIPSALVWAAGAGFDAVVCAVGPGIVGTGSPLGHGGVAAAEAANVGVALAGFAVIAVRVSFGDPRGRHHGVSHHTRAVLDLCLGDPAVAWPAGLEQPEWLQATEVDAGDWRAACNGLPLEHMGRGPDDDPWFFASAFAAGRLAREHLR
jgi:Protein of unknown function (DUF3866)